MRPTASESHSSANRRLFARNSATSRCTRWSAGYRLAAARSSATCAASSSRRDCGVCRMRSAGPRKVRHTALRSLPRRSPISAVYGGLASSVHAASETATGVPVSRSGIRCTPGVM
jgi:hypothetical protein